MVISLLIAAVLALCLLWVDRQSKKEIIERQDTHIRNLTGQKTDVDKLRDQRLTDAGRMQYLMWKIQREEEYMNMPRSVHIEEAKRRFKNSEGYEFVDHHREFETDEYEL